MAAASTEAAKAVDGSGLTSFEEARAESTTEGSPVETDGTAADGEAAECKPAERITRSRCH